MAKAMQCDMVSWARVVRLARKLAFVIHASGFTPDLIVAIARGGYVPARLLADYLGVMALTGVRIVHYTAGARRQRRARLVEPLPVAVRGKRVLVVDDVADSGETYELACRHIARARPAAIRTAALHYKTGSRFVPDYCAETQGAWRWINYPWARIEDIGGFIERLRPRPADAATAARRLAREFGMRVPRSLVADALRLRGRPASGARRETGRRAAPARRAPARTRSRHRTRP
jgi:hypoxanthine phosphoribosyltransferase